VTKDFDGKSLTYETEDLDTAEVKISGDHDLPHLRTPDILIGVNDLTHLVTFQKQKLAFTSGVKLNFYGRDGDH
jgi:hypothetical protein